LLTCSALALPPLSHDTALQPAALLDRGSSVLTGDCSAGLIAKLVNTFSKATSLTDYYTALKAATDPLTVYKDGWLCSVNSILKSYFMISWNLLDGAANKQSWKDMLVRVDQVMAGGGGLSPRLTNSDNKWALSVMGAPSPKATANFKGGDLLTCKNGLWGVFHTSPVHHVRCQDKAQLGWAWIGYNPGGMTIDQKVGLYWIANGDTDIYPDTDSSGATIMHKGTGGTNPYPRRGADHGFILYTSEDAGRAAIAKELEYGKSQGTDLYSWIQNLHAKWGDAANNPWKYYQTVVREATKRGAKAPISTSNYPSNAQCDAAFAAKPHPSWPGAPKLDAVLADAKNKEAVTTAIGQQEGFYSAVIGHQCAFSGDGAQLVPNKEGKTLRDVEPCNKILNLEDVARYLYYFT